MKNLVVISFLVSMMFVSCTSNPKSYVIKGVADESYNNQYVYMFDHQVGNVTDSALVANGKFSFTGSIDTADFRQLFLSRRLSVVIILENGNISVDMASQESAKGTTLNEKLSKYMTEMSAGYESGREALPQLDSLCAVVFNENKNNALGTFVLLNWNNFIKAERFDSLYSVAGDIVRNHKLVNEIIKKNLILKQTAEGMPFTDFTVENGNSDGSAVSFSDYIGKGKYILVDFWASWCGPCIAELPVLLEVYNKYKGVQFDILGVAVWDKRADSEKAIEKHNLQWAHIIDGGENPAKLYGIESIPHIILFAPDGTIVARGLRGDALIAKVAEIVNN